MKNLILFLISFSLILFNTTGQAASLEPQLKADKNNPVIPTMGDWMHFNSLIHNTGKLPITGLVVWISLVEVTPGHEQPMDLEDWSAHKAVTGTTLSPGSILKTSWPMRLIKNGDYRVVISATDQKNKTVFTSPTIQFHVTQKPVVEFARILPVALGLPLLIGGFMGYKKFTT